MSKLWKNAWWIARGILGIHFLLALATWFFLPSRIPKHFNAAGQVDAWDGRSLFAWFILVAVSFGVHGLIWTLVSPILRNSWNIPEKERFLRLSVLRQAPVLELMQTFGGFSAACVSLTFFILHLGMYLATQGIIKGLPWYFQVALFTPVICLLVAVVPWSQAFKRAILNATSASAA